MAQKPPTAAEARGRVKLMIFDVDGVLTDGSLFFSADGEVIKTFNSLDGLGIKLLQTAACRPPSSRAAVGHRRGARADLGITHVYQGIADKSVAFAELLDATGVAADECGYIGDDWIDLAVMRRCGFAAAPANGHPEVMQRVHYVTEARGGRGAVREVCDAILRAQHRYDELLAAALGG